MVGGPWRTLAYVMCIVGAAVAILPGPGSGLAGGAPATVRNDYSFIDSEDAGGPKPVYSPESMAGYAAYNFGPAVDGTTGLFAIGFPFVFYGTTYTQAAASGAGVLTFGAASGGGCCANNYPTELPGSVNNAIYGAWADYDAYYNWCTRGNPVHVKTFGTTPARMTVVEFAGLRYETLDSNTCDGGAPAPAPDECSCSRVTFQIKLFETSNLIEIHWISEGPPGGQTWQFGNLGITVGIQRDATSYLQYMFFDNAVALPTADPTPLQGTAVRFRPANQAPVAVTESGLTTTVTTPLANINVIGNDVATPLVTASSTPNPAVGSKADPDNIVYSAAAYPIAPGNAADNTVAVVLDTVPAAVGGTAVLNADQTVTFTPSTGVCGDASFSYHLVNVNTYYAYAGASVTVPITVTGCSTNGAPTAVCAVSPAPPYTVGQSITFAATGSSDPDSGDTLTYAWTFPGGTPSTSAVASQAVTFAAAGSKAVSLTVTDNNGLASAPAACPVTIADGTGPPPPPPPPPPPVTSCGITPDFTFPGNQTAVAGDVLTFQDTSTPAPGATIMAWAWTFGDGNTGQGAQVSHAYPSGGEFQVGLTVTDTSGCTSAAIKPLTVYWPGSQPDSGTDSNGNAGGAGTPVVYAGDDVTVDEGDSVRLEATGYGASGTTLTYSWRQLTGLPVALQGAKGNILTFTAPGTGGRDQQMVFGVRVSDGFGSSAEDTLIVNVRASNHAPVANAGSDQTVAPGQGFTLSAAASQDADGDTLSFTWSLVRGAGGASAAGVPGLDATGESVQLTAPTDLAGTAFDVQLTASDGLATSADTVRIWIVGPGTAPPSFVARAQPNGAIQFTAVQDAALYSWEFGDGNVTESDTRSVTHTYADAGTYTVVLRLDGSSEGAEQTVTASGGSDDTTLKPAAGGLGNGAWMGLAFAFVAALLVGGLLVWALRARNP